MTEQGKKRRRIFTIYGGGRVMRKNLLMSLIIFSIIGLLFIPCSNAASGKKIIVAIGQEPTSIDQSLIYVGADYIAVMNWGERLIEKTSEGELVPGLATSWKISPDGKTIDFTLRKGVKFHTGDPFTANDVKFSYERALSKKNPTMAIFLRRVDRVEIIDDYRVKIHFKEPEVAFIPNQGYACIVSKSYYDRVGEDTFTHNPVGTGAYKFVKYVPGEYIDIEAFDDYWGGKPSIEKARFLFVTEDMTRVSKLKAGEVDLLGSIPYSLVPDLEKTPGIKLIRGVPGHPTPQIQFNNLNPKVPWHDRRVRLAMAHAINYDAIINKLLLGIPKRYACLAPWEIGYDPNLKAYDYNPELSKKLLTEAGYPNGFDFTLYYLITGTVPMMDQVAETVASYFEAVGIRTKLRGLETGAFQANRRGAMANKGSDIVYVGLDSRGAAAGGVSPVSFIGSNFETNGGFSVFSNPEFDKYMDIARSSITDIKKQGEAIKAAAQVLYDDCARIPLYSYVPIYAMKENVDFKPMKRHPFEMILLKNATIR
jgi:peptide/nickel transport system substrate-binding protein